MSNTEEKKPATYIRYVRGRARVISEQQWEQSWLNWWYKHNNVEEIS